MNTKLQIIQVTLLLLFFQYSIAQPSTTWKHVFGGSGMDVPKASIQTNDDGFLIIGTSDSGNYAQHGNTDLVAIKTGTNGGIQWSKAFGTSEDEQGYSAIELSDGGFVVCGVKDDDFWILKLSATGTQLWEKTIGSDFAQEIPSSVKQATDGSIIIGGTSYSSNMATYGNGDFILLKLNGSGDIIWQKNYGGSKTDQLNDLKLTADGGIIAIGTTYSNDGNLSFINGQSDIMVVKTDLNGDLNWLKNYGDSTFDGGESICQLSNGKYAFVGTKAVIDENASGIQQTYDNDIVLGILSSSGVLELEKTYGGTNYDWGTTIVSYSDIILIGGNTRSYDGNITSFKGQYDAWVMEADLSGNINWQKSFGGNRDDKVNSMILDRNGGIVLTISTNSNDQDVNPSFGNRDILFLKLDGEASFSIELGDDKLTCGNTVINLNAFVPDCSNCTYSWSTGQTSSSIDVNPSNTTTYSVTVTNGSLVASDAIQVIIADQMTVQGSVVDVACNNENTGSISLSVNGVEPILYDWSNNLSTGSISNLVRGTYSVTIEDGVGCTTERSYTINQPEAIIDNPTLENICGDNTKGAIYLSPSGGVGNFTYSWNDQNTSKDRTNLDAGFYQVTITDANQCNLTESFEITENGVSISPKVEDISCYGKQDGKITLELEGNIADYDIQWSPDVGDTRIINGLSVGIYALTITNNLGCSTTSEFEIQQPEPLIITSIVTDNICADEENGEIEISVLGGTSPYDYSWSNGKMTPKVSNLDSDTYKTTITDSNGCTAERTFSISEPSDINVDITVTDILCSGEATGFVEVSVSGGTPNYNLKINDVPAVQGVNNGLIAGEYNLDIEDQNNCTYTQMFTIQEPEPIEINVLIQGPTNDMSNGNIQVIPVGGTPDYEIVWDDGTIGVTNENVGPGNYPVQITDANGCKIDTVILVETVAVKDISEVSHINLFPNPTSKEVYISTGLETIQDISLYNTLGNPIPFEKVFDKSNTVLVSIMSEANGIFLLILKTDKDVYSEKIFLLKH